MGFPTAAKYCVFIQKYALLVAWLKTNWELTSNQHYTKIEDLSNPQDPESA